MRIKRPNIVTAEAQPSPRWGAYNVPPDILVGCGTAQTSSTVSPVTLHVRPVQSSVPSLKKWIATVLDTMR